MRDVEEHDPRVAERVERLARAFQPTYVQDDAESPQVMGYVSRGPGVRDTFRIHTHLDHERGGRWSASLEVIGRDGAWVERVRLLPRQIDLPPDQGLDEIVDEALRAYYLTFERG